ncbi:hypothetical protein GKJPGBOP_00362 [Streptomyces paromomycinus]|uniref:Uncharacterized protein n=1 Tax=Streptomyces paromomycinus TaxID=92743 RepID=A0A401VUG3_STREY|nr:hypothetical protein GKJPGBOP_00362 [Streptomyces paromomycinus]
MTLLTAVLFYFGWASSDAESTALGLQDSLFHLSTSDYLLRSVQALFLPAWVVAGAALAAVGLHRWAADEPRRTAWAARRLRFAWLPPLALLAPYRLHPGLFDLLIPLSAIIGFLLTAYARTRPPPATPEASGTTGLTGTRRRHHQRVWALTVLISVLLLFWAVYAYAGVVGRGRAAETARSMSTKDPAVVVFSKYDLMIRGGGSCYFRVLEKGSAFGFRYSGLRLFHIAGDRVYVVPVRWSPGEGTVWVLEKSDSVRVEYVSGPAGRAEKCE